VELVQQLKVVQLEASEATDIMGYHAPLAELSWDVRTASLVGALCGMANRLRAQQGKVSEGTGQETMPTTRTHLRSMRAPAAWVLSPSDSFAVLLLLRLLKRGHGSVIQGWRVGCRIVSCCARACIGPDLERSQYTPLLPEREISDLFGPPGPSKKALRHVLQHPLAEQIVRGRLCLGRRNIPARELSRIRPFGRIRSSNPIFDKLVNR